MDEDDMPMKDTAPAGWPRYAAPIEQGGRHTDVGGQQRDPTFLFPPPSTQHQKYDGMVVSSPSSTLQTAQILGFRDDVIGKITPLSFGYGHHQSGANGMPDYFQRRAITSYADIHSNNKRSSLLEPLMNMMSCSNKMMMMNTQEMVEAKALAASKSHSEAERKRRERINRHLTTLRGLLPNTTKTDKASLLREVIEHVKQLKQVAEDIEKVSPVPSESDQISVDNIEEVEQGQLMIKASLSCDDRPDLFTDFIKALKTLRLRTVKAEMATLGGRVKNVVLVTKGDVEQDNESNNNHDEENPSVSSIQDALKSLLDKNCLAGDLTTTNNTKRQRQVGQFSSS